MNELLFFLEIVLTFGCVVAAKKIFGKAGLIAWIAIAMILANLTVVKTVNLFGIDATLGNIMFASTFLAGDMLNENYGRQAAHKGILVGLGGVLVFMVCTQISLLYTPSTTDVSHDAMALLFALSFSKQVQHHRVVDLVGRPPAQALARPAVQVIIHRCDLVAHGVEVAALGEVLAQQPVGVLVGPAVPRMVRRAEVALGADGLGEQLVLGELLAAVEGDRPAGPPDRPGDLVDALALPAEAHDLLALLDGKMGVAAHAGPLR